MIGGIISYQDGRLNPIKLLKILMQKIDEMNINKINDYVSNIKKNTDISKKNWKIYFTNKEPIDQDFIIICSAINSQVLLNKFGYQISLEPILGQVVELQLEKENNHWI